MSDNEPSRGGYRARGGRDERRNRSQSPRSPRSPRRDGRRDNRYRSRSPVRDGARDTKGRGRGGTVGRDDRSRRSPPRGPRGGGSASSGPRRSDFAPRSIGAPNPPTGPRASTEIVTKDDTPDVEMKEEAQRPLDMDDDEWEMRKTMGFGGFKSTKDTKVPGNDKNYGVRRDQQVKARQYMNRQGGFNRPLSPSRG